MGKAEILLHKMKGDSPSVDNDNKVIAKVVFMPDRDRKNRLQKTATENMWRQWGQKPARNLQGPKERAGVCVRKCRIWNLRT